MSAVPFAVDLLTADPLAAVRRIAAGDPPDLVAELPHGSSRTAPQLAQQARAA